MSTTTDERRGDDRVRANLQARWEGVLESHGGTVVDLSITGCFILTPDAVQPKELVRLDIQLPAGGGLMLWGEVVYVVEDMGFALRFTGMDEGERKVIEALMETLRTD
ncbi:MAG TPA: PilZ domain-containing protein [Pyrinomonadaceae bacterium]|jgi:hypothetical protein|nr:PilZ domain-containing protein [Pyrinomonadaceae bacterium]